MIIPINNGRSIIPIYIPTPSSTHSTQVSDQVSDQVISQETQPKEITGLDIFFIIFVSVFIISVLIYFIHLMKELTK